MRKAIAFILLTLSTGVFAADIEIKEAWIRAVPPTSKATAAFLVIMNKSALPVEMVGASTSVATSTRPMITVRKRISGQEVTGMEYVNYIRIPAYSSVVLEPGGDHLMLNGLVIPLTPGLKIKMSLRFEPGHRIIDIELPVKK